MTSDLMPESGIDEKQLSELSKAITLMYDANYYKEKKAEELVSKLELFNSFIEDVNMNAIAIGEAGVDLGGALTNVFNTNLEENILLSPIYYTFTGFGEYIKGNMTHEETVEYFKRVIESLLIVEGGVKALEKGYTIVKKKLLTTPATGAVEGLNQVDDIIKTGDDIIRYEQYWDDLVKRTDDIPPNWTPDEYQKYLNATEKVDAELALKKIDADELIEARRKALNEGVGKAERLIPGNAGVVKGGDSTKLGKNIMESMGLKRSTKWTGHQAQHIIPAEMADNPVLQKIGMNLDDATNGILLRTPDAELSAMSRHRGYHSVYNDVVRNQLNKMDINQSVEVLQKQVFDLQSDLRKLQESELPLYPSQGATVDLWERSLSRIRK